MIDEDWIPVVCIQQFVQALCGYLCNMIIDQIHKTLPCPAKFSSHGHKQALHFHPKHLDTNLSMKSLQLLDLYQAHKPARHYVKEK